ncbi:hypothetical protein LZ32DRAFT_225123 [Colletotrichum eremochloae]|nr:hypothetical protein LZ32DRAFT_225123 [Colletotrichum eremochloae]
MVLQAKRKKQSERKGMRRGRRRRERERERERERGWKDGGRVEDGRERFTSHRGFRLLAWLSLSALRYFALFCSLLLACFHSLSVICLLTILLYYHPFDCFGRCLNTHRIWSQTSRPR